MGINICKYPYFLCVDADSVLQTNSLKEIVAPVMENDDVIAVGGSIRILNDSIIKDGILEEYNIPSKAVAAMQVVEYDRTISTAKFFFNKIKGNAIISGAFGLFRKDIAIEVGGYDTTSLGEDMDLVMSLTRYCKEHKVNYRMEYVPSAICWTQGVESLKDLRHQRTRWHLGMKQNLLKHKVMLFNPKYGSIGTITLPIFLLFEVLSPIVEIIGLVGLLSSLIFNIMSVPYTLLIMSLYSLFGILSSIVAYTANVQTCDLPISKKDYFKVFLLCLYELFFMHFYLLIVRFIATFKSSKKKRKWIPITRSSIE